MKCCAVDAVYCQLVEEASKAYNLDCCNSVMSVELYVLRCSCVYVEYRASESDRVDLCYLAPLWLLYQKLYAAGCCRVPCVVQALTELFYTAENLAVVSGTDSHTFSNLSVLHYY